MYIDTSAFYLTVRLTVMAILVGAECISSGFLRGDLARWVSIYVATVLLLTAVRNRFIFNRIAYLFILVPEMLLIFKIVTISSALEADMLFAYFFIIITATLNLGLYGGIIAALAITLFDIYHIRMTSGIMFLHGPMELRLPYVWLTSLAFGFIANRNREIQSQVHDLNSELDSKVTLMVSAGRILSSLTDTPKLFTYFQETLTRVFGISRYMLAILSEDEKLRVLSSFGLTEAQQADLAHRIRVASVVENSELRGIDMVIAKVTPGTQGRYILIAPKDAMSDIATDPDLVQTIYNQFIAAFDSMLLLEKATQASLTDHMTGLYNQRYFYDRLHEEFKRAERTAAPLSVLIIDVDDFKKYNDEYGHLSGDKALAWVAEIIKRCCRESDIVARYGGEEFAVILPDTTSKGALDVANRIIAKVNSNTGGFGRKSPIDGKVTVSIGIASYPEHGVGLPDIMEQADKAMYAGKTRGKNRSVIARKKRNAINEGA